MKRRIRQQAVVAAAVVGAALLPGVATAQAEVCVVGNDFNGDGCADLAVADPDATVDGKQDAGRIVVVYGNDDGERVTPTVLSQGTEGVAGSPETGDRFGTSLRAANVNGDRYQDLVIATPSESVGTADDAGIIQVVFGSADGLGAGRTGLTVRQGLDGTPGTPEAGDRFGAALAVNSTVVDGNPAPAVAFGAPGEDIGDTDNAGTAGLVRLDPTTGEVSSIVAVHQDSDGISGAAEPGDQFGAAVEVFQGPGGFSCDVAGVEGFTLVVGAPGEDLDGVTDGGMVHLVADLASDTTLTQNRAGVSGTVEPGDRFGSSLGLTSYCEHDGPSHVELAVGVPAENIGDVSDAGMVHLFATDDDELPLPQRYSVHQGAANVTGILEAGDRFGTAVMLGGQAPDGGGGQSVVVTVPGEDVGTATDAGALYLFSDTGDAPGDREVAIDHSDIGEPADAGDHFGIAIAIHVDFLFIGVPDDVRYARGAVHGLLWSKLTGDGEGRQLLVPGSDGIPLDDSVRFGASVA